MIHASIRSLLALALLAPLGSSQVVQQCHTRMLPFQDTNWIDIVDIPKFNPGSGTLLGVGVSFRVVIQGSMGVENLSDAPSSASLQLQVLASLHRPDNSPLAQVTPALQQDLNLAPYDFVFDYSGPSGITIPLNLDSTVGGNTVPTSPADLALFTFQGGVEESSDIYLPVLAQSFFSDEGTGYLSAFADVAVRVEVQVCYTYDAAYGLRIAKESTYVVPGRIVDSYIAVTNNGPDATNLDVLGSVDPRFYRLLDVAPAPVAPVAPTANLAALGLVAWRLPFVAAGDTVVLTYRARLDPLTPLGTIVHGGPVWVGRNLVPSWMSCAAEAAQLVPECACVTGPLQACTGCAGAVPTCLACGAASFVGCGTAALECSRATRDAVVTCFETSAEILARFVDDTPAVGPFDPNEKRVVNMPVIRPTERLVYAVHYENVGTLPAESVTIEDVLDPHLDVNSLVILTPGGTVSEIPGSVPPRYMLRWEFLDANLLPMETRNVQFTAKPTPGIMPGTTVRNRAKIGFESLPQIETNEVVNTIDGGRPTGRVNPLPPITMSEQIVLTWTGTDVLESGVAQAPAALGPSLRFSIYVSKDNGPYEPFLIETGANAATYAGQLGSRYSFFCIARDEAGNVELQNPIEETSTLVFTAGYPTCLGNGSANACPCGNASPAGTLEGCRNSLGRGGRLVTAGNASVSADTLLLAGSQMPDCPVVYFQGTTVVLGGAGSPFGDGLRCAGGTVIRLADDKVNVNGGSQHPAPSDRALSEAGGVVPGSVRVYQVWYRNAASFCTASTFNLTNAVVVTWLP